MKKDQRKQYDNFAEQFSIHQQNKNQVNRNYLYKFTEGDISGKKVLDLCCGDGIDVDYHSKKGAHLYGIDASKELIKLAQNRYPLNDFCIGLAEDLPYDNQYFDFIYSKYAIMTSKNIQPIFNEVHRVLKSGGIFVYLVTHPFRQFMERKDLSSNYFLQKKVECHILDDTVTVIEPTHTMNEYFNGDFFSKFELLDFEEVYDPAAEMMHGATYPGFFIVKARKK